MYESNSFHLHSLVGSTLDSTRGVLFCSLSHEPFSLGLCPVNNELSLRLRESRFGMQLQVSLQRHLALAKLAAHLPEEIDAAVNAVLLPGREVHVLAPIVHVALDQPRRGCDPTVERPLRVVGVAVAALLRKCSPDLGRHVCAR